MGMTETLLFYFLIGCGVATATAARADGDSLLVNVFQSITALFFWPLYIPVLLSPVGSQPALGLPADASNPARDDDVIEDALTARIKQVDVELDSALASLDGWSEEALARERARIAELRLAWKAQAARIREMDQLLAEVQPLESTETAAVGQRVEQSERARQANFARLHQVRQRAYDDLTSTLARVRELVSLIHLAKFTGEPASRAEDLVAQIAAAVEGLSEVAGWRDEPADSGPAAAPLASVS